MSILNKGPARLALDRHYEELAVLKLRTIELTQAALKEATEEREIRERADWEREVVLGPADWGGEITATATWPRSAGPLTKWLIGVGCKSQLLAVWEVTNYKGGRIATLWHYFPEALPPVEVELEVFRRWGLKRRA